MKAYVKPRSREETQLDTDELLVMNPHPVEYSWGTDWTVDSGIEVGDVTIQGKEREEGTHEEWGDLW